MIPIVLERHNQLVGSRITIGNVENRHAGKTDGRDFLCGRINAHDLASLGFLGFVTRSDNRKSSIGSPNNDLLLPFIESGRDDLKWLPEIDGDLRNSTCLVVDSQHSPIRLNKKWPCTPLVNSKKGKGMIRNRDRLQLAHLRRHEKRPNLKKNKKENP